MPKIRDALDALEKIAPKRYAFSFDKVGLQVGDPYAKLERAVVTLDRSLGAVSYAADHGAQLLVAHHPLIFEPLATVLQTSHTGRTVLELARNGIAFAAAHTNWDSARGGINDTLASILGLNDAKAFGSAAQVKKLKLVVFAPAEAAETIIDAASGAGAGLIGNYSRCAFASPGQGTFLGNERSSPSVGKPQQIGSVAEMRIEMVVPEAKAGAVSRAIRGVHPYEEPAFDFHQLAADEEQPAGRIGVLQEAMSLAQLVQQIDRELDTASWAWGSPDRPIRRVAVVGGAADGEWRDARQAKADVLVTGEVKQHVGLEAAEEGFAIIAAGHYATEHPGCVTLRDRLAVELPDVEWLLYEPPAGSSGRPFIGR